MDISFYNTRGEFTSTLSGDPGVVETTKEMTTDAWVEGAWFGTPNYVLDGAVIPRPENPATLTGYTLENLPVPSTIIIKGHYFECTDSVCTLEFNFSGTYAVKVLAWPYLDKEFTVDYSV